MSSDHTETTMVISGNPNHTTTSDNTEPIIIMSEDPNHTAHLAFLCSLDLNGTEEDLDSLDCPECHEPYDTSNWVFGEKVEYPVARYCGHYVGLKCLIRMEELGHKECPQCLSPSSDELMRCMKRMNQRVPGRVYDLARIDMAIRNAISTAGLSRDLGMVVDWLEIFLQVYEASYLFYEDVGTVNIIADYAFIWPFRLLEAGLRKKGLFNGFGNVPVVRELQKDLNDLRKRLDSRPDLPEKYHPDRMPIPDLRRTTFVTAVNEMREEKGEIGWPKHQTTNLLQNSSRFYGHSKVKGFMELCLIALVVLLVFLTPGTNLGFFTEM